MIIDFSKYNPESLSPGTLFEERVISFLKEWFSVSQTVPVQTSGSTGIPKVFEIEKSRMRTSAEMTCGFLNLNEGDCALLCLPVEYISGKMMLVRSIERRMKLIVKDPSVKPLEDLNQEVDFCAMTPLQVEYSLDKIHLVKNLIIGGAAVSESLKNKIAAAITNSEIRIFETYGMSETLSHIALKQIFPMEEEYFTPFKGVDISLDERGCMRIFAPELNSKILQTNDLVELRNDKRFEFLGRADNIINSGGAKIFPEQLESLVKKNLDREAVFIGIPDDTLGQKLVLVIEGEENENLKSQVFDIDFEKSFHKPKSIVFRSEIPRTPNGKVDRLKLSALFADSNR